MSLKTYTYDPKNLIVLVGTVPVEVAGPVVITRANDVTTEQVSQTGDEICVNHNRNKTGTVTIPVMAQSIYDAAFDELANQAEKAVLPFFLVEKGSNKFIETTCWYKTQPDLSYGEQVELRAHVLTLADATIALSENIGGLYDQMEAALAYGEGLFT